MVLVDICFGVHENDLRAVGPVEIDQVFQDLLARMGETAGLELADQNMVIRDPKNRHAAAVLRNQMCECRVFLIVG